MPIPAEMKSVDRWVLWDWEAREGKPTKIPRQPSGAPASSTDPATWSSYEAAAAVEPDHAGLGFVFSADDPICGIDLDACYDAETMALAPWAQEILALCGDSYVEISPSGTGLKIFGLFRGKLSGHRMGMPGPEMDGKAPGWERYTEGRYFTVTEREGSRPRNRLCDLTAAMAHLDSLLEQKGASQEPQGFERATSEDKPEWIEGLLRLDADLYARWSGVTSGLKDPSPSAVDQAIANLLAFYGRSGAEIEQALLWRRRSLDLPTKHQGYYGITVGKALTWASEQRKRDHPLGGPAPSDESLGGDTEESTEPPEDYTWEDLAQEELKVTWAVQGLLPSIGISCLAAKPKSGKSTLARDLAYAIGSGDFWIQRGCLEGRVLYVDADGTRKSAQDHVLALPSEPRPDISYVHPSQGDVREIVEMRLKQHAYSLVILDTLQTVLQIRDLNDYAEVGRVFSYLRWLCEEHQTHIMLVHHDRKAGGEGGDSTLGSTAIFGGVDTLIQLDRSGEGIRTVRSTQRDGEDMEPTELDLRDGRAVVVGLSREQAEVRKVEQMAEVRATSYQQILDTVTHEPGIKKTDLVGRIKGNQQRVRALIDELVQEGALREEREGRAILLFLPHSH